MEMIEEQWCHLFTILQPFVLRLVCRAHLPAWEGQEFEVAQDITSAAIRKIFEYIREAEQNGVVIGSLDGLAYKIARNLFLDTLRKDRRLLRGETAFYAIETSTIARLADDPKERVLERLHHESLYRQVARMVVGFPAKLRQAMLVDFATRMLKFGDFEGNPLKQAFDEIGVQLKDYLPCIPDTRVLRSRHASLVSLGYQRIAKSIVQ